MDRREFINRMSFVTAGLTLFTKGTYSSNRHFSRVQESVEFIIAETAYGKLRGVRIDGVNIYKGVPYAGSVSGLNRFKRPAKLESWTGVKDAIELGAPSIQDWRGEPKTDENCLFMNIWTPANDNKKRPVMFYNHGGGYVTGSGGAIGQDGANLARYFDVVLVQTNHRLGLLGFLYLDDIAGDTYEGSGNMGTLDIITGLKWVNENIGQFGGDPDNIMIFGESGGGGKTAALYAMPEAYPYFNKASIESGPGVRMLTKDMASTTTEMVLKELNLKKNNWHNLLKISPEQLLEVQKKFQFIPPYQEKQTTDMFGFGPVVDGNVLPYHPFDPTAPLISKNKPLLTGWNEDEFAFFIMQNRNSDILNVSFESLPRSLTTDFKENTPKVIEAYRRANPDATAAEILMAVKSITMMGLGSIEIAEKKALQGAAPVYLYNFGYKSEMKIPGTNFRIGTPHAMDISYKFYNVLPPKEDENNRRMFADNSDESINASYNFAELWTNFARTGVPYADGVPKWPAYDLKNRASMRIDANCEVINDRFKIELDMWRQIGKL